MAKEKPRCVMCGQETEFFRRSTLPLYNTNQIVCADCKQRYECAGRGEQEKLKEQMLRSPHLWDRERLESLLKWKQEEGLARSAGVLTTVKAVCCGKDMQAVGTTSLPITGSGALQTVVYRCTACGQVKLFTQTD